MADPKKYVPTPDVDKRANEAFLDTLIDTDGKPMREAVDLPPEDDEDEED